MKIDELRKYWEVTKAGDLNRLKMHTGDLGHVPSNKLRIKTRAIGLNFADVFAVAGLYSATPPGSFIPGLEFAGELIAKGADVTTDWNLGTRLFGVTRFGGYSSIIDIEPEYCKPIPGNWSWDEAAAFPVQTISAWYALSVLGALHSKSRVLIHSLAGGVGLAAATICRKLGASCAGTVRSQSKRDFLHKRGIEKVVVRKQGLAKDLVSAGIAGPFDIIIDGIGGKTFTESYELLSPMGRLVVMGAASFTPTGSKPHALNLAWKYLTRPKIDPLAMISENRSVMGFNLIWLWEETALLQKLLDELMNLGLPPTFVGETFSFDHAPDALRRLQSGQTIGKVILHV